MAYRVMLSALRRRSGCDYSRPALDGKLRLSTSSFQRVSTAIKNDPFVKLSLSLCALIVGGTLVMELYNRLRKNSSPSVLMLPPGFAHHSVRREPLLMELRKRVGKGGMPTILYVTGSPGSGKTELVRQFSNEYGSKKWLGLKSVPAMVVCVEATSPEMLQLSLCEVANRLGLQPSSNTRSMFSAVFSRLMSNKLPWLLVIDHLTENTQSFLDGLLVKCVPEFLSSQSVGTVLITTSAPVQPNNQYNMLQVSQRLVYRSPKSHCFS